jgi:ABC-2 type transport system ATP-binding protein
MLRVRDVSKVYRVGFRGRRVSAVQGLSFAIEQPQIVGFAGPNGAGKTTTIKMILGLLTPSSGEVLLNGRPAFEPAARKGVGYVSEQPYFYEQLTVEETLNLSGGLLGLSRAVMGGECERVLSLVELGHTRARPVRTLSKGMQQRLSMAQALLGNPKLLMLDEPMSGLDPPSRRLFRSLIRTLHQQGCAIFFSTHVLDDIVALCSRLVVLSGGSCVFDGPVEQILERGFEGTELSVAQLPPELQQAMVAAGCTVEQEGELFRIVAPAGVAIGALQQMLAARGLFCRDAVCEQGCCGSGRVGCG